MRECVLVTGAGGFVGINIVRRLAEDGIDVVALARRAPDALTGAFLGPCASSVRWELGDVTGAGVLEGVIATHGVDAVVHAAAVTPTAESEHARTRAIIETNLYATVTALDAARAHGVDRFLYVSSTGVYASTPSGGARRREDETVTPRNLYDTCKLASEQMVREYVRIHGLSAASLRVGSVYGPMERASGSRSNLSLVDASVRAASEGRHLTVRHPEVGRDAIHALDVAQAVLELLGIDRLPWTTFNLAGDVAPTVGELLDQLALLRPFTWEESDSDDADLPLTPEHHRDPVDLDRLRTATGFALRVGLRAGLEHTLAWNACVDDHAALTTLQGGPTR